MAMVKEVGFLGMLGFSASRGRDSYRAAERRAIKEMTRQVSQNGRTVTFWKVGAPHRRSTESLLHKD